MYPSLFDRGVGGWMPLDWKGTMFCSRIFELCFWMFTTRILTLHTYVIKISINYTSTGTGSALLRKVMYDRVSLLPCRIAERSPRAGGGGRGRTQLAPRLSSPLLRSGPGDSFNHEFAIQQDNSGGGGRDCDISSLSIGRPVFYIVRYCNLGGNPQRVYTIHIHKCSCCT